MIPVSINSNNVDLQSPEMGFLKSRLTEALLQTDHVVGGCLLQPNGVHIRRYVLATALIPISNVKSLNISFNLIRDSGHLQLVNPISIPRNAERNLRVS